MLVPLCDRDETRHIEAQALASGLTVEALMETAAERCFQHILARWGRGGDGTCWLVLTGPGHNGGDGFALARKAAEAGIAVQTLSPSSAGDSVRNRKPLTEVQRSIALSRGVKERDWNGSPEALVLEDVYLVVDALYGFGLEKPLDDVALALIRAVNSARREVPRIAIDLPSGLCAHTGQGLPEAIRAHETLVLGSYKRGLLEERSVASRGDACFVPLGFSRARDAAILAPPLDLVELLHRAPIENKLSRGELFLRVGSEGMHGAGLLALAAARTTNPGYLRLSSSSRMLLDHTLQEFPETLLSNEWPPETLERVRVAVVGCGMPAPCADERCFLTRALPPECCVVLDGGWCDAKTVQTCAAAFSHTVVTPHGGEFAKLLPSLHQDLKAGRISKIDAARRAAEDLQCHIVLKGPYTAIASPQGMVWQNTEAHADLAQAGSGDALAGFLGGMLLQASHGARTQKKAFDPMPALGTAVNLHGSFRENARDGGSPGRALVKHLAHKLLGAPGAQSHAQ